MKKLYNVLFASFLSVPCVFALDSAAHFTENVNNLNMRLSTMQEFNNSSNEKLLADVNNGIKVNKEQEIVKKVLDSTDPIIDSADKIVDQLGEILTKEEDQKRLSTAKTTIKIIYSIINCIKSIMCIFW